MDYRLSCPAQSRGVERETYSGEDGTEGVERVGGGGPQFWRRDLHKDVMHLSTGPGSVPVGVRAGVVPADSVLLVWTQIPPKTCIGIDVRQDVGRRLAPMTTLCVSREKPGAFDGIVRHPPWVRRRPGTCTCEIERRQR